MLCAPLSTANPASFQIANEKADYLELILDSLAPNIWHTFAKQAKKPLIFKMSDPDEKALAFAPSWVDLPMSVGGQTFAFLKKKYPKTRFLCSVHDNQKTPDLLSLYEKMQAIPADGYKIATKANSLLDSLRMLSFVEETRVLGLCMGPMGSITRVLAPFYGAPWMYAPVSLEESTAEGQLPLSTLWPLFKGKQKPALFGLLGEELTKSRSAKVHQAVLEKLGISAFYCNAALKKKDVALFLEKAPAFFQGMSVTMPYKQTVCSFVQNAPGPSLNTLKFEKMQTQGINTDGPAALDLLEQHGRVKGKRISILGSGGVALAIGHEAEKRGAIGTVFGRVAGKKIPIFSKKVKSYAHFATVPYEICIQATPLGMEGSEQMPICKKDLRSECLVLDVVNRKETFFLQAAKEKKCTVISGVDLWIAQAALQYAFWFGEETGQKAFSLFQEFL